MVVQAAVIQIDGAHDRLLPVHDHHLGVGEAGGPLADFHTGGQQRQVMGLGQSIDKYLVRLAGQDQVHIHAALCRKAQGRFQLAV